MSLIVDIEKRLGDFTLRVDFRAEDCVHGLLGASGCGKSMTLRCIAGVVRPDKGHIEADGRVLFDSGKRIDLQPQARRVGLLFQNYALFPNMTLEGNLRAALHGTPRAEAGNKIEEMCRHFHLEGLEKLRPAQLSGGPQQRAALARILLTDPAVLMLDEPLSALDSYLRWQTELELMETLDGFPGTTLLVSHSRDEVHRLCRTVTVLDGGRGSGSKSVAELFSTPSTRAECLLSGCKNYSAACRLDAHSLRAADWGAALRCEAEITENVRYVGVRSHHLRLVSQPGENVLPCSVTRVVDDVFSTIVIAETGGGAALRLEMQKEEWARWSQDKKLLVYSPPEHVMPLK